MQQKWLVKSEVPVTKIATNRQQPALKEPCGDGFSSIARTDSAVKLGKRDHAQETSRRATAVTFEQSAQPLFAADIVQRNSLVPPVAARGLRPPGLLRANQKFIFDPLTLMWTFIVIMLQR
ncbi:MAG: hypothetical protein SFX18_06920 [Pirellulales bacterium]|nr:hypothetical protein [Pirellulales bacterium]